MALVYSRLGDYAPTNYGAAPSTNAPNFVEIDNNPDQSSSWVTNYAAPAPPKKKAPAAKAPLASPAPTTPRAAGTKSPVKRAGAAGSILDRILPLMIDQAGTKTIYGLPPALVYVAGGILSATLLALLLRVLGGGGRRRRTASNPKRAATSTTRRRAKR